MRGVFRATGTVAAVTTAKTLVYVTAPSDAVLELLSARVTAQDEDTSEQMFVELNRIATLGTPTATTLTPKPTEEGSAAFGGTCKYNVTGSEPTYDAVTDAIAAGGANKLAGWEYVPLPEERAYISPGDTVALRLVDALSVSTDLSFELTFREIGG